MVPYLMLEDHTQTYKNEIKKGICSPTQFSDYETPVVPVRKTLQPCQQRAKLRVYSEYSVTVNAQLETRRHPMTHPDDLIRKLDVGYMIDLSIANRQIELATESQKRLPLSTHRGIRLQTWLPFGTSSAPGYFQEIMEKLTSDIKGVADAVYIDDILVNGTSEEDHLENLKACITKGHKVDTVTNLPAPTNVATLRSFLDSVQFYSKFITDL